MKCYKGEREEDLSGGRNNTKLPGVGITCKMAWQVLVEKQCQTPKETSLFFVNPRKAAFVSILYIFLYHFFVHHLISKSCQFCPQNSSRLLMFHHFPATTWDQVTHWTPNCFHLCLLQSFITRTKRDLFT